MVRLERISHHANPLCMCICCVHVHVHVCHMTGVHECDQRWVDIGYLPLSLSVVFPWGSITELKRTGFLGSSWSPPVLAPCCWGHIHVWLCVPSSYVSAWNLNSYLHACKASTPLLSNLSNHALEILELETNKRTEKPKIKTWSNTTQFSTLSKAVLVSLVNHTGFTIWLHYIASI